MSRNKKCKHPNCDGGPCKSLTREELTPSDADRELARQLLAEGWIQTSSKHRHIRRWAAPGAPAAADLIAPEFRDTPWGRRAIRAIERHVTNSGALHSEFAPYDVTEWGPMGPPRNPERPFQYADHVQRNPLIEERTLTPSQFAAYKIACKRRESIPPATTGDRVPPTRDPSHWAASELGTWPGQPHRETMPTMISKYGTVRCPDGSVVFVDLAMSTKDAAEKAYALKNIPGLYTVVNEDGVDQYAHTQPPTELERLFEVAHLSAQVIDKNPDALRAPGLPKHSPTARWVAAVDALRGMKPPAPLEWDGVTYPDEFWNGDSYAPDPRKRDVYVPHPTDRGKFDPSMLSKTAAAVRRAYPDLAEAEDMHAEADRKLAAGDTTKLSGVVAPPPTPEQEAEWRRTWADPSHTPVTLKLQGQAPRVIHDPPRMPPSERRAIKRALREPAFDVADLDAPACENHWHCDPRTAAHVCTADRSKPCFGCGAEPAKDLGSCCPEGDRFAEATGGHPDDHPGRCDDPNETDRLDETAVIDPSDGDLK